MSTDGQLTELERALYARQIRLPGVGEGGQLKIKGAKVLLIGAGGLGSPAAMYLAAAGVGVMGIADPDKVELNNLHRQIIHGFDTQGLPKTISAAEALAEINPGLKIILHPEGITTTNAMELVSRYDLVLDGADNFSTRYLVADACVLAKKPLVHGSVLQGAGQVGVFVPEAGCYRCVYPTMPKASDVPTCAEGGVMGATCGVIGSWMASEAIAIILGQRTQSRLLIVDVMAGSSRVVQLESANECPACGEHPEIHSIEPAIYISDDCAISIPKMNQYPLEVSIEDAAKLLSAAKPPVLIDVREPREWDTCRIPQAKLIPMGEVPARLSEIPQDVPVLVQCHHGGRSLRVTQFLRSKGYTKVSNVMGGIEAWSLKIDKTVARY